MDLAKYVTDKSLEKGVWVDLEDGLRVKIARLDNPEHRSYVLRKSKFQTRGVDMSALDDVGKRACAATICLGWENLHLNGVDIPFSQDKAIELFRDYPEFFNMVISAAGEIQNFQTEEMQNAAKNCVVTSDGV